MSFIGTGPAARGGRGLAFCQTLATLVLAACGGGGSPEPEPIAYTVSVVYPQ
jgi:hypothetical protein